MTPTVGLTVDPGAPEAPNERGTPRAFATEAALEQAFATLMAQANGETRHRAASPRGQSLAADTPPGEPRAERRTRPKAGAIPLADPQAEARPESLPSSAAAGLYCSVAAEGRTSEGASSSTAQRLCPQPGAFNVVNVAAVTPSAPITKRAGVQGELAQDSNVLPIAPGGPVDRTGLRAVPIAPTATALPQTEDAAVAGRLLGSVSPEAEPQFDGATPEPSAASTSAGQLARSAHAASSGIALSLAPPAGLAETPFADPGQGLRLAARTAEDSQAPCELPGGQFLPNPSAAGPILPRVPAAREHLFASGRRPGPPDDAIATAETAPARGPGTPQPSTNSAGLERVSHAVPSDEPLSDAAQGIGQDLRGIGAAKPPTQMRSMSEQRPGTARTARPSPDAGTWPARHAAPAAGEAVETESAGSAPVQKNAHHQTQASNIGLGPVVPAATHLTPDMPLNHHHDDRIPQVERLADLLRREVFAVRRLGAHSLVVTLKPDPETEFLFRVTQRDGHIEAQLQIERGDPAALLPHWHHLTEALARQGVRLLPLMAAPGFTSETPTTLTPPPAVSLSANDQPPSHPRRSNREPMEELPPAGPRTEPLSRRRSRARARSPHQFERWA